MPSDYEKKLIEMQFQLRENQSYMSDTFKELEDWSTEMKQKEDKLKAEAKEKHKTSMIPPVRSLAQVKKKKKVKKVTDDNKNQVKKSQKIRGYDYRAWDKLNVDELCEQVDQQNSSSSSDYTTDEEWEHQERINRANWEKERGNLFFKDNLFDDAINCYTRAIELDPINHVLPANRAMCLLKQEKYASAELDCTLSIHLNDKYSKAYHRRGQARLNLEKFEEAARDFEQVIKLEPNNKQAQEELRKIENKIESRCLIFPIDKPLDKRSTKPLKRIEIVEINGDVNEKKQAAFREIQSKIKLTPNEEKLFETKVEAVIEQKINVKEPEVKEVEEKSKVEEKQKPKVIPPAPSNAYQFRKDWQYVSCNIDDLLTYFKVFS
jgi:RNA polymerase II-associated protein 3